MHLILFDIDGTLTRTTEVDDRCYISAVRETLGIDGFSTDWATYRDCTDPGIASELIERHHGRQAQTAELDQTRSRFAELLAQALRENPECCTEIPGATAMLVHLRSRDDVAFALATGGWRPTAQLKLAHAKLPVQGIAFASGNDARSRVEILRTAISRVSDATGHGKFDSITAVGDGVWDLWAANDCGFNFIGIGTGERAAKLHSQGARIVLADYRDLGGFLSTARM